MDAGSSGPLIIKTIGQGRPLGPLQGTFAKFEHLPEIDLAAASLVVNDQGALFSGEGTLQRVEIISSGFLGDAFPAPPLHTPQVKVRELAGTPTNQVSMKESRWGALAVSTNADWMAADAYEVVEGPLKDIVFIPIVTPSINKDCKVYADVDGDSVAATVSIRGRTISAELQSTEAKVERYKVRLTGKIDKLSNYVDLLDGKHPYTSFDLVSQPSRPVILVTLRKFAIPVVISSFLRMAGVLPGVMVGGFGKGTFSAELVLKESLLREKVIASATIGQDNSA